MTTNRTNQTDARRAFTRILAFIVATFSLGLASPAVAETRAADQTDARDERGKATEPTSRDHDERKSPTLEEAEWEPVAYIPPSRGRAQHTAGAGTRTFSEGNVTVAVLAPSDHVALTTRAQPTLYWYVSQDTSTRIDLTVVDDDAIDPLLEWTVPGPVRQGIHALDLSQKGLTLESDKTYRWHVALVQDSSRRSNDTFDQGFIVRTPQSEALLETLDDARERYAPYATSGIWYDAMHELLMAIEEDPDDERLQRQRNALLDQAGLSDVVNYALRAGR